MSDLESRVRRLEDEAAIQRLVLTYGPAADAALDDVAANLWLEDGDYDWDGAHPPLRGRAAVAGMLRSDAHRRFVAEGVAHFGGPLLIDVHGDSATAVNYSLIMRRDDDRFYLWRVSAVRWELERSDDAWKVRRRSNRLLDDSGAGSALFADALRTTFSEGTA